MTSIIIYADGASRGNPGPAGWGAIVAQPGDWVTELGGASPQATNNQMELTAALEGLRYAYERAGGPVPTVINLDSRYVIDGATQWIKGWQRSGWRTANRKPVKNRELWEQIIAAKEPFGSKLQWRHVPAHRGIPGNERADRIAVGYATGNDVVLFTGAAAGYGHSLDPAVPS